MLTNEEGSAFQGGGGDAQLVDMRHIRGQRVGIGVLLVVEDGGAVCGHGRCCSGGGTVDMECRDGGWRLILSSDEAMWLCAPEGHRHGKNNAEEVSGRWRLTVPAVPASTLHLHQTKSSKERLESNSTILPLI